MPNPPDIPEHQLGLILPGGGTRAAYQVGVLKAIAEMLPRRAGNPFHIICGTSAGALNAATLAVNARQFRKGVHYLDNIWRNFQPGDVYRTDTLGVLANAIHWLGGVLLKSVGIRRVEKISLLDNAPLEKLLKDTLRCEQIQESIDAGYLQAISITASSYGTGQSVTFYQGVETLKPWMRAHRMGIPSRIDIPHLMASAAIPFFFPAVRIDREYYGDGSMRQIAPVSPAVHLGASRVLVISPVSHGDSRPARQVESYPSLAQVAGHTLDSIFLDSLEVDVERINRNNQIYDLIPAEMRRQSGLRHVDVLVMSPSQSIEKQAARYIQSMPWTIRLPLALIGVTQRNGGANLLSYLMPAKEYCRALIDMGYRDAMGRREELQAFIHPDAVPVAASPAIEDLPQ